MSAKNSGGRVATRRHLDPHPEVASESRTDLGQDSPDALFSATRGAYGTPSWELPDDGAARRDDGVRRADHQADAGWKAEADRVIVELAATGRDWTADELHDAGLSTAINSGAYGGRILAAARAGLIRKVGYTTSARPGRRAGATAVWRGVR